jgi:hypothetical protein
VNVELLAVIVTGIGVVLGGVAASALITGLFGRRKLSIDGQTLLATTAVATTVALIEPLRAELEVVRRDVAEQHIELAGLRGAVRLHLSSCSDSFDLQRYLDQAHPGEQLP